MERFSDVSQPATFIFIFLSSDNAQHAFLGSVKNKGTENCLRPLKINCAFWVRIFLKSYEWARQKNCARWKTRSCFTVNIKYDAHVFLPESAKHTSEVTKNAQFILRGLRKFFIHLNLVSSIEMKSLQMAETRVMYCYLLVLVKRVLSTAKYKWVHLA